MFDLDAVPHPGFKRLLAMGPRTFAAIVGGSGLDRDAWLVILASVSFIPSAGSTLAAFTDDELVARTNAIADALDARKLVA